ncbi:MAG: histidine ammonia-lyase [Bacteroidetes bacterium GWE2_29_8]|nr:MAG: histidine ammonia-lyase [Bacteroidetes bacterium GWE2_29_8]OFY14834.1 MAG: histidine ammonia-lyase [Bacteroidetes bacterium GWF2_29_10]
MVRISSCSDITLSMVESIVLDNVKCDLKDEDLDIVKKSFDFLYDFSKNKIIYGINTGFGPMSQYKIDASSLINLQYNLIRSHSAGAGPPITELYVKVAMLVRMRSLIQGYSGVHPSCVILLKEFINNDIYPFIPEHGGVGASGDLVQLSHLALTLIGEGQVTYKGELKPTLDVLKKLDLKPIVVSQREGLSLINGTSVMTGIGIINVIKSKQLFKWSIIASCLINEIVSSFDDHFSKELNSVKKHKGQNYVANQLRSILRDSNLMLNRESYFYSNTEEDATIFNRKVQECYSLRCIPQILGPVYDTITNAEDVLVNEMNSVSDNPIIDVDNNNVFHGGNFHGDYVSIEMDKLKLAVTRMSMLSERHLSYLCNSNVNKILPPFINLGQLGLNLGMQGAQFTSTSTVAENQMLSNSMYVHSITTNNDNQDIVSMGTNSALITKRVIDNSYQVQAIEMIALLQAIDCLNITDKLSSYTQNMYKELRKVVPAFIEDTPKYEEIELMRKYLFETKIELL